MTIEEMRQAITDECDKHPTCTENGRCPLYDTDAECDDPVSDEEVKTIYHLLRDKKINDLVNHPSHYSQGGIECLEAMEAAYGKDATATFCLTNAFKYIWRTEHKNGIQDIDKAIWYLNKYKELKEDASIE